MNNASVSLLYASSRTHLLFFFAERNPPEVHIVSQWPRRCAYKLATKVR